MRNFIWIDLTDPDELPPSRLQNSNSGFHPNAFCSSIQSQMILRSELHLTIKWSYIPGQVSIKSVP